MFPSAYPQWRPNVASNVSHTVEPTANAAANGATAHPIQRSPEEWFRANYPDAFVDPAERVFATRDGEFIGLASEYMIARCLSPQGSPDRPVVYCPEEETFYLYDAADGIYRSLPTEGVRRRVVELLEECAKGSLPEYRGQVLSLRRQAVIRGVEDALKTEAAIPVAAFEPDYTKLPLRNGLVDLRTLQLQAYSPTMLIRGKLDIEWHDDPPQATQFDSYLGSMFPDPADRVMASAVIAMSILGNRWQRVVFLLGAAGGGKTTFAKLIGELVSSSDAGELRLKHVGDRFEASGWVGKRLLTVNDAKTDELVRGSEYIKRISGHDPTDAEFKNSRLKVRFTPRALPLITANPDVRLKLENDRGAWERRLIILRVAHTPRASNRTDFERHLLATEGPGIVKAIAHAAHNMLRDGPVQLSSVQRGRVDRFLDKLDPVGHFVGCCIKPVKRANVSSKEALEGVLRFYERLDEAPPSARILEQQLKEAIGRLPEIRPAHNLRREDKVVRGWRGVRMLNPGEVDLDE